MGAPQGSASPQERLNGKLHTILTEGGPQVTRLSLSRSPCSCTAAEHSLTQAERVECAVQGIAKTLSHARTHPSERFTLCFCRLPLSVPSFAAAAAAIVVVVGVCARAVCASMTDSSWLKRYGAYSKTGCGTERLCSHLVFRTQAKKEAAIFIQNTYRTKKKKIIVSPTNSKNKLSKPQPINYT